MCWHCQTGCYSNWQLCKRFPWEQLGAPGNCIVFSVYISLFSSAFAFFNHLSLTVNWKILLIFVLSSLHITKSAIFQWCWFAYFGARGLEGSWGVSPTIFSLLAHLLNINSVLINIVLLTQHKEGPFWQFGVVRPTNNVLSFASAGTASTFQCLFTWINFNWHTHNVIMKLWNMSWLNMQSNQYIVWFTVCDSF